MHDELKLHTLDINQIKYIWNKRRTRIESVRSSQAGKAPEKREENESAPRDRSFFPRSATESIHRREPE